MEQSKELKEKVENAKNAEEAKKILEDVGIELTDTELDQVAGGFMSNPKNPDQEIII